MKILNQFFVLLFISSIALLSCSSDDSGDSGSDDDGGSSCGEIASQTARGNFRGDDFISPQAFYEDFSFGGEEVWRCEIWVKNSIDGDCSFPEFEGTQDLIIFNIPSLEAQEIELSASFADFGTLNFNRISQGTTTVELAECGIVSITGFNETTGILTGGVYAEGQEGSLVNGTFAIELCQ